MIQDLSDKINKLNDKVDYQTTIILNLTKENNIFKETINNNQIQNNNSITITDTLTDTITDTLKDIEKNKGIANNIIFTNKNIDSNLTDFNNTNKFTDYINKKLDTKLSYNNILHIRKSNTNKNKKSETDDVSNDIDTGTKYIIKLDSLETKLQIFKNKNKLFDTNIYINQQLPFNTHTIFYKTRQLRKLGKINKTWIYKDTVYVNANKEDLKSIIEINNIKQLCEYELN